MRRQRHPIPSVSVNLALPILRETPNQPAEVRTPADCYREISPLAAPLAQEAFFVITLTTKYRVIDRHLVSLGILDACLVHPREVFRRAVMDCAAAVLLAHNHPSGDPSPSREDLKLTRQLIEAGRIMDIEILDHVIIGQPAPHNPAGFTSLRESGLVSFASP